MTCRWHITAPDDHIVKLAFQSYSSMCKNKQVKLFDGNNTNSSLVKCPSSSSSIIYSQSRDLIVEFTTTTSPTGWIFATFEAVKITPTSCLDGRHRLTLTASNGTLSSSNYPHFYPNVFICSWGIKVPLYQVVKLTFHSFDLQTSDGCSKDYLQVSSKSLNREKLGKYCGNKTPKPITGIRNEMYIEFYSDWAIGGTGFLATYEAVNDCKY